MSEEAVRPAFEGRDYPLISYGIAFPAAIARHLNDIFRASRVYVICSGSLSRNTDVMNQLETALGPDKLVGRRIGMRSHTLWSEVLQIAEEVRTVQADLLLTVGGGSLSDGAKLIALVVENQIKTPEELETLAEGPQKRLEIKTPTLPIISVPTSLSAGEYYNFAGGTDDRTKRKHAFKHPTRGPKLVILDPELAETTPDSVWLSTGVRAVDHCIETLCAMSGTTAKSDKLAQRALGMLVPGLLRCKKDRSDRDAHLQCQLGSVDAMAAWTEGPIDLGASHGIGHQLGPLGVGHGETSCVLLPAVCKYNAKDNANREKQASVRQFMIQDPVVSEVVRSRSVNVEASDLSDILDAIIRELGMPRSLSDVKVGRDQLDELAENSLHDHFCKTNPVPLNEKSQVLEILEMVV
ncbi:uncharacterized protein N7479_006970 [Penicillium vulpinum]|uniref:Uncharacterized protein n=1 Tax=Penicillium vulpinum TaxID=29845 RepID=A0A1V6S387_9EURO|nr:uncharacterized protein N7479_006970 [Penicillium vulpinum]KAJ5959820.1 hypothetical protein N7479_006970 [Penicillium vulpinum]OQE08210.1 hypothetical protein PENVUL_c010G00896 [Penicillium vulpinum]